MNFHIVLIIGEDVSRVQDIRDLSNILTPSLNPEAQILDNCVKANKMLGSIFCFSRHGSNVTIMKILHCALVVQLLEYCSIMLSPRQRCLCEELEKIQRRFARIVRVKNGFIYHQVTVENLS